MSASRSENIKNNETTVHMHPLIPILVALVAGYLIVIPLLPVWTSNVAYSFSGAAPKVYWYLSRAAGFVALTILWISMALGLGITNKMARLWPGAPTAFAIHQFVSLVGLAFALYHELVLMGDHFVDFSLPRLLTPFSIAYETFWVGLGQLAFYFWIIVVLSFYVRKFIGQKTWRAIHYINFGTYLMGLSHGIFSGTDANLPAAQWYYWVSAVSLLALAVYRIYETKLKTRLKSIISNPREAASHMTQKFSQTVASRHVPTVPTTKTRVPQPASVPVVAASVDNEPLPTPVTGENLVQTSDTSTQVVEPLKTTTETPTQPVPVSPEALTAVEMPEPVLYLKRNELLDPMEMETPILQETIPAPDPEPVLHVKLPVQPQPDPEMTLITFIKIAHSEQNVAAPVLHLQIKRVIQAIPVQPNKPLVRLK